MFVFGFLEIINLSGYNKKINLDYYLNNINHLIR